MKGYNFMLGIRMLGHNEADARRNVRNQLGISDNIPDEFIEFVEDDGNSSSNSTD